MSSTQGTDSTKGTTRFPDMVRNALINLKKMSKNFQSSIGTQQNVMTNLTYNIGTGKRANIAKYPKQGYTAPPSYPDFGQFYFHKKPTGRETIKR